MNIELTNEEAKLLENMLTKEMNILHETSAYWLLPDEVVLKLNETVTNLYKKVCTK